MVNSFWVSFKKKKKKLSIPVYRALLTPIKFLGELNVGQEKSYPNDFDLCLSY